MSKIESAFGLDRSCIRGLISLNRKGNTTCTGFKPGITSDRLADVVPDIQFFNFKMPWCVKSVRPLADTLITHRFKSLGAQSSLNVFAALNMLRHLHTVHTPSMQPYFAKIKPLYIKTKKGYLIQIHSLFNKHPTYYLVSVIQRYFGLNLLTRKLDRDRSSRMSSLKWAPRDRGVTLITWADLLDIED